MINQYRSVMKNKAYFFNRKRHFKSVVNYAFPFLDMFLYSINIYINFIYSVYIIQFLSYNKTSQIPLKFQTTSRR